MTIASDSFTRADSSTLGANWSAWTWAGAQQAKIVSNHAVNAGGGGTGAGDFWNANTFGADQFSQVTVSTVPASSDWVGVTVRQSGTGGNGYLGLWFSGSYYLFRENGTTTPPQIGSAVPGALTAGDTVKLVATGTTIALYHNGASVLSVTDSTTATGAPGIAFFGPSAALSSFSGGDGAGIPTVTVATSSIANVVLGVAVKRWLLASGGSAPYTWSVASGALPAGLTLASDGTLSGTPATTGTASFTVQATDSQSISGSASLSVTTVSAPFSPGSPTTDGNGVQTYPITSAINTNTAQTIRVKAPDAPAAGYPPGYLILLPVNAGTDDQTFGNGLDTARALGLHNLYNLTLVEPSTGGNWLADNPSNSTLLQETYLLQVAAWIRATFGPGNVYLVGFSRSGIAAQGLAFHHPEVYQGVASWDFPAGMTDFDGTDPNGTVGGSSASSYGTSDNFKANYLLSSGNIAKWVAGFDFGTVKRVWIGGYSAFLGDVTGYDPLLTSLGVLHDYSLVAESSHNWAPSPGWLGGAVASVVASEALPAPALDVVLLGGSVYSEHSLYGGWAA